MLDVVDQLGIFRFLLIKSVIEKAALDSAHIESEAISNNLQPKQSQMAESNLDTRDGLPLFFVAISFETGQLGNYHHNDNVVR